MIKRKLWGFRKKDVDKHISEIQEANKRQLEDLTEEIGTLQRENDLLWQELSTLTETDTPLPSLALLEPALQRVENFNEFIKNAVDKEASAFQKSNYQKLFDLKNMIGNLDKAIKEERENLVKLKDVFNFTQRQELRESNNKSEETSSDLKKVTKVFHITNWLINSKIEKTNQDKEFLKERLESHPQVLNKEMTADGITLRQLSKADTLQDRQTENDELAVGIDSETGKKEIGGKSMDPIQSGVNLRQGLIARSEDKNASYGEAERTAQLQAGLRQEIGAVRYKYVVGQVAGEDLLGGAGRVIIRKGDMITESVMAVAEKEGKLVELIIHMILPGQEEE